MTKQKKTIYCPFPIFIKDSKMIETAAQTTVKALLSENNGAIYHYVIPPYQREYAWNKTQWDNLFDDLIDNEKGYFLGSLICILGEKTGQSTEAIVIDGQQRLTTLNLLLLAMYRKFNDLLQSTDKAKEIFGNRNYNKEWLSLQDYLVQPDNAPRLTPSIQNKNSEDYAYLVRNIVQGDDRNTPANYGNRRMAKAFKHFADRIETYAADDVDAMFALLEKILAACVVRIDTKDEASAFILFESINNRGVPLTPMDLIKNSMISNLKTQSAEQTNEQWQQIVNRLNEYEAQVRYLRHFYQAFKPVRLIWDKEKGKEKITKNDLIQTYTAAIKQNPAQVLQELTAKAEIYQTLSFPENITADSPFARYQSKLADLKKLGVAPAYTLLLFLFNQYPRQDFTNLLNYLEQWFMARHLTNVPATNRTDDIFIAAAQTQHAQYNEAVLFAELQKALPARDYIKQALQSVTLYEDNPALVRYILVYLEQQKRTAENRVDFWATNNKGKPIWSVEHIYPQKPKADEWADNCKEWLHSLGNLTLTAYNSNLSNRSFAEKASVKDDKDNDIGLQSGNVKINDFLCNKSEWNAEHIEKRGNELIDMFLNTLPQR